MKHILTIGSATKDTIFEYESDKELIPGDKIEVSVIHESLGGGALNSAASFAKQKFHTTTLFKVGVDAEATFITDQLQSLSLSTHIVQDKKHPTGMSFIIPDPSGDRIVLIHRGANSFLTLQDIPLEIINQQDAVYITSLSQKSASLLPHITYHAHKHCSNPLFKVAVNPGSHQLTTQSNFLKPALSSIDVLILNADEMQLLALQLLPAHFKTEGEGIIPTGPELVRRPFSYKTMTFTLYDYCKKVMSYGVKRVVVTNGKEGVYVITKDRLYFHPALDVPVINTLGAGDAFGSTFFAALLQNKTIEDAIAYGMINASSVIGQQGAQKGLLTVHELEHYFKKLDKTLLKAYYL